MTTPVVAFLTMKGGVGKTTLAANLTSALADRKKLKILLIDGAEQQTGAVRETCARIHDPLRPDWMTDCRTDRTGALHRAQSCMRGLAGIQSDARSMGSDTAQRKRRGP